jgi:beta-lactamase regulating signal transducer with metallopeptidase domain
MIIYILKTLLCAAVLFLIYTFLLEKEKMHRFNRFYLLFSIVFSLTVSFITIKTPTKVFTVNELIAPVYLPAVISASTDLKQTPAIAPVEESFPWSNLFLGLYIAGTTFFLIRFIRNLFMLLYKAANNKSTEYHGATLILENNLPVPHSFLSYIFIDREKFEQGTIEKEILQHELTHVKQKHSIDILLVELIMVFAWVNPLLFLFRKAIMLNHEYLADDAVVHTFKNTESYRLLLFNTVSQSNNLVLSSPFNYLITKKRLLMMTKNTSRKVAIIKQIALIPLIAAIGFFLSTRVNAQDNKKQPTNPYQTESNKSDAPQSVINEYLAITAKYIDDTIIKQTRAFPQITAGGDVKGLTRLMKMTFAPIHKLQENKSDKDRLEKLFLQMSQNQQRHQFITFTPKPPAKPRIVPTKEQYAALLDSKVYGIWVNGWRVKNSNLKSHSNTEYAYYSLNKLNSKIAKEMGYEVSVTLQTKKYYEDNRAQILKEWSNDPSKYRIGTNMINQKMLDKMDEEAK